MSLCFKFTLFGAALSLAGSAWADINLGQQQASAQAYAIFGQPGDSLTSATASIDYVSSTAVLGSDASQNNIDLSSKAHSLDQTSYSLLEGGSLPLRTNSGLSEVIVTIPMISGNGTSCLPVFERSGDSSSGVTAFFSVYLMQGITSIAHFVVKNDLNDGTDLSSSGVTQSCPSSGIGTGSLSFDLSEGKTSTYEMIFDIGYEFDGARRVVDSEIAVYGDDGEPYSGTYVFTLDVSLSAEGGNNNGGGPCDGNCGVGRGLGGGNGTDDEGNPPNPPGPPQNNNGN